MIKSEIIIIIIVIFLLFKKPSNKNIENFTSVCKTTKKNCKNYTCSAKNFKKWIACVNNGKTGLYPRLTKSQIPEDKKNFIQDKHMCNKKYSKTYETILPVKKCIKKCLNDNDCLSYAIRPNIDDEKSNCRIYLSCNDTFPKGTDEMYKTKLDTGKFYNKGNYEIGRDLEGYIHRLKKPGISTNGICSDNLDVQVNTKTKDTSDDIILNRKLCKKDGTNFGCVFYPQSCSHLCNKEILDKCTQKISKIDENNETNCNQKKCGKFFKEMKKYKEYYKKSLDVNKVQVGHLVLRQQILNKYPRCKQCDW